MCPEAQTPNFTGSCGTPSRPQRCWSPGARRVTLCLALKFVSASLTQVKFCLPLFCCFCGPGEGGISGLYDIYLPYSKRLISQSLVQGSLSRMALVTPRLRLLFGMLTCAGSKLYLVAAPPHFEVGDRGLVWEPL